MYGGGVSCRGQLRAASRVFIGEGLLGGVGPPSIFGDGLGIANICDTYGILAARVEYVDRELRGTGSCWGDGGSTGSLYEP